MSSFDFHPKLFLTNGTVKTTGTSANLAAGEIGLYNPFSHQVVTVANVATHPVAYVAQGSFYASDTLGVNHGGYKESIKSPAFTKGINPKMVKKFYKVAPRAAVNQTVRLFWNGIASTGPSFLCGKSYYVRLEVKGEPVLRTSNRYLYKHLGAFTGCCANDCSAPCTDEVVDAALVMRDYATQINEDPQLKRFITATPVYLVADTTATFTDADSTLVVADATGIVVGQTVTGIGVNATVTVIAGTTITISTPSTAAGTATPVAFSSTVGAGYVSPTLAADKAAVVAGLIIAVTYTETVFADNSFSSADYYNNKFIEVLASMVYQNGDVCEGGEVVMNHSTGAGFFEVTPFVLPKGSGEIVLRDFIASQLQSGIFFSHDPRSREISGNVALTAVNRAATYTVYSLMYSVQQTGNPSNALSQDQYILNFAIKTGDSAVAFEALFAAWFAAHNPAIVLETIV